MPCYTLLYLIIVCLATPCYCALLLALSCLIVGVLTLLCCSRYFCCLCLVTMPSHLATCLFQVPPSPPNYCFVALLFIMTPCISTPSSLSCVSGGAWNNTNKFHPTTKVFFSPNFLSFFFFFLLCILFIFFVIFVLN
jgi:hypothetical protein